jgi:hypothetical protein
MGLSLAFQVQALHNPVQVFCIFLSFEICLRNLILEVVLLLFFFMSFPFFFSFFFCFYLFKPKERRKKKSGKQRWLPKIPNRPRWLQLAVSNNR